MLTIPKDAPSAYHVLVKPTGAVCNLDCKYCFFLSKEMLYPGSRFRMADDLLETYLRQLLESHTAPEVTVAWQGGEPTLMGLDFFERSVELAEKYRKPGQSVTYTIQTNGTKLDDEWCAFFKQHNFLVGLSVDGPARMHDTYRVNKGGAGHLRPGDARPGCPEEAPGRFQYPVHGPRRQRRSPLEVYRFFRDELGAQFIQFIPIVERATETLLPLANEGWSERPGGERPLYTQSGGLVTERSVGAEQFGRFLIAIFDEWVRRDVGTGVRADVRRCPGLLARAAQPAVHLQRDLRERAGAGTQRRPVLMRSFRRAGLFARQHPKREHDRAGLIRAAARLWRCQARYACRDYCRECEVRFACHGECPRNRFITTPDGEPGLNYLCAGYKAFFNHIDQPMRIMADLLRRGRYADEVMQILADEEAALQEAFAKARGHDPCPCGSGLKYRKCHGRREVIPAA